MVSRVLYRPFEEGDIRALARIIGTTWHADGPSEEFRELAGAHDLTHMLSRATFSQVAVVDGRPSGIVLARRGDASLADARRWTKAEDSYYSAMRAADPVAADAVNGCLAAEGHINEELLRRSGLDASSEVLLLIVDPAARGRGIGGVLLDAANAYLESEGCSGVFLFTDTGCSWPFYERYGFKRAGEQRTHREQQRRQHLCSRYFVYALDFADA